MRLPCRGLFASPLISLPANNNQPEGRDNGVHQAVDEVDSELDKFIAIANDLLEIDMQLNEDGDDSWFFLECKILVQQFLW